MSNKTRSLEKKLSILLFMFGIIIFLFGIFVFIPNIESIVNTFGESLTLIFVALIIGGFMIVPMSIYEYINNERIKKSKME